MQMSVYLDESGDLGWKFELPYRKGGSSRYLTIAAILIAHEKRHHLKRLMKDLYHKTKTPSSQEVKWANLSQADRLWIAEKLANLKTKLGSDIRFMCISVKKSQVKAHIRKDPNKLYNYMIKVLLINELARYPHVIFNIDQRSMKVESGNSLHDYLQTEIWLNLGAETTLETKSCDSKHHLGVQLADILSGIVQSHFEDGKSEPHKLLAQHNHIHTLFF